VIAVIQNFALIFSDKFKSYGITMTDLTLILNINSAVCNGLGQFSTLYAAPIEIIKMDYFNCRVMFGSQVY